VDEVVIPHDDEEKREDSDKTHQDPVANDRMVIPTSELHKAGRKWEDDDIENDDVGEVAEDVGGDPDFGVFEGVNLLAVGEALGDDSEKQVSGSDEISIISPQTKTGRVPSIGDKELETYKAVRMTAERYAYPFRILEAMALLRRVHQKTIGMPKT